MIDPRDEFEAKFPMPAACIRIGEGTTATYAATHYSAWDAHNYVHKWEGWKAARDVVLDKAAAVVADHNREGRGWIPGSLWDTLANEAAARVLALKGRAA
jgi:hypothetical protein